MDEREFELINIIGGELGASQREISRQMNLSLGMTNMLIHRLLTKGHIRIKQLNKKKVEYLLTPKGFAEKMQKSVKYTLKTLNSIGLVKKNIEGLLARLHGTGVRKFSILGASDLAGLIEMVLAEEFAGQYEICHIEGIQDVPDDGVILICREGVAVPNGVRAVQVIDELAKDEAFLTQSLVEDRILAQGSVA